MPDPLDRAQERAKKFLREDPFQDAHGANPFHGPGKIGGDRPASDNPFAPATDSSEGAIARQFVQTQEPRGALLLILAVGGLATCSIGILAMLWRNYVPLGMNWLPVPILSLAASVPAVTLSYADMLAMEAGAMAPTGWAAARVALILGIISGLMSVGYSAVIAMIYFGWISI